MAGLYDLTVDGDLFASDSEIALADGTTTRSSTGTVTADRSYTAASTQIRADSSIFAAETFNPLALLTFGQDLYEVPLKAAQQQTFTTTWPGGVYRLRLLYTGAPEGGWTLDIGDSQDRPLVCGIPLVTGADLLAEYRYLGFGGRLFVIAAGDPAVPPGFADLGAGTRLYFEAD